MDGQSIPVMVLQEELHRLERGDLSTLPPIKNDFFLLGEDVAIFPEEFPGGNGQNSDLCGSFAPMSQGRRQKDRIDRIRRSFGMPFNIPDQILRKSQPNLPGLFRPNLPLDHQDHRLVQLTPPRSFRDSISHSPLLRIHRGC